MQDPLPDRMKAYEDREAGRRLMPLLPALARVDGRRFSQFTRGLDGPFDARLARLMADTALWLAREAGATAAYIQSDEITLAWVVDDADSQIFFDGRLHKMVSQLAALATAHFLRELPAHLPAEYAARLPTFDARVWSVPTTSEAANVFLWRQRDALKNSVAMAARHHFSHNQLKDKNGREMKALLRARGVDWAAYPAHFRHGTFFLRRTARRPFTAAELERLPEKHAARRDPGLIVERTDYVSPDLPPLDAIANRAEVLFRGQDPVARAGPDDAPVGPEKTP